MSKITDMANDKINEKVEPVSTPKTIEFTEEQFFMLEAADDHGFKRVDEDGDVYQATEQQIVSLITAVCGARYNIAQPAIDAIRDIVWGSIPLPGGVRQQLQSIIATLEKLKL